jgi:hypothetical protein
LKIKRAMFTSLSRTRCPLFAGKVLLEKGQHGVH